MQTHRYRKQPKGRGKGEGEIRGIDEEGQKHQNCYNNLPLPAMYKRSTSHHLTSNKYCF